MAKQLTSQVTIVKAANGYIVDPTPRGMSSGVTLYQDFYVFESLPALEDCLQQNLAHED